MESLSVEKIGDRNSESKESSVEATLTLSSKLDLSNNCIASDNPSISAEPQEDIPKNEILKTDISEKNVIKFSIENTLVKTKFQLFSPTINRSSIKEGSNNCKNKSYLSSKNKKDMFSDEKTKTIIQDKEDEKPKELKDINVSQLPAATIKSLHLDSNTSKGFNEKFRRREIKQRNYRRTYSNSRKSLSPDIRQDKNKSNSSSSIKNPKDWSEYKLLKPSERPRLRNSKRSVIDLLDMYNFRKTPHPVEKYRYTSDNGMKEISPFFLKKTKTKPSIMYSFNLNRIKESYLSRDQLLELVPNERKQIILNIMTSHSKLQPFNKKINNKAWYSKTWRKQTDAECKLLENSVGLSFLQTYSDEEEEIETEEILICSSINQTNNSKGKKTKSEQVDVIQANIQKDDIEIQKSICTEKQLNNEPKKTEDDDDAGILTPEIPAELQKSFKRMESEENKKPKIKTKKNKSKNKNSSKNKSESASKKKKKKREKSESLSSESTDSHDLEKKKKSKRKKEKNKKIGSKVKQHKDNSLKDHKSKKKTKITEELDLKEKKTKKSKKEMKNVEVKSPILDELRKNVKKRRKRKKNKTESSSSDLDTSVQPKKSKNINIIDLDKSFTEELGIYSKEELECPKLEVIPQAQTPTESKFDDLQFEKNVPEASTPDTNDCTGNFEDKTLTIKEGTTIKLNSSWESDDEIIEPEERPKEPVRNYNEVLNLEIPLNIKPFKKRTTDIDISYINSEEFDIEKEPLLEPTNNEIDKLIPLNLPGIKLMKEEMSISSLVKNNQSNQNSSNPLENEYMEFMKAVTTNNVQVNSEKILNKSNESVEVLVPKFKNETLSDSQEKTSSIVCIKDIPLIPMPDDLKPEPVPSPKPIDNLLKPIINFNLQHSNETNSPLEHNDSKLNLQKDELLIDSSTHLLLEDVASSNILTDLKSESSPKKLFNFSSLVIPTKKLLLDNSKLKLDDSDDESNTLTETISKGNLPDISLDKKEKTSSTKGEDKEIVPKDGNVKLHEKSPVSRKTSKKDISPRRNRKRESSPRHRGGYSPKREPSPKRRRRTPERHRERDRLRDRERARDRKRNSLGKRYSRRSLSPIYSPKRRSPKRSLSPKNRANTKPKSNIKDANYISKLNSSKLDSHITADIPQSPSIASPLEGLKRSVADSTISDDSLLPQPNIEEYTQSPIQHYYNSNKPEETKRISLDERISMELGWHKEEVQPITTIYDNYHYNQNQFSQHPSINQNLSNRNIYNNDVKSNFVQVGNMVEIVPKDMGEITTQQDYFQQRNKSQIVQVGNVLQIVPTELPLEIPLPPPTSQPTSYESVPKVDINPEKVSIDLEIKQKMSQKRMEREMRKKAREARRKEKENRRREKEQQRNIKMKQKTENMIMRALQLEVENNEEISELNETATHWPPPLNISAKDLLNRSILTQGKRKSSKSKKVQFADGIRPGEGTSPSAGEDLYSPPPSKVLPKEKRYTKTKLRLGRKKKVKVKLIKENSEHESEEDEEEDHLPPPSPPPGSPPPHVFPPRIKPVLNNIHPYVPNMLVSQNQSLYNSSVNPIMAGPHISQLHITSGQPPPPIADPHLPVHHLGHYPLASAAAAPPPMGSTDSPYGSSSQRSSHLYKYTH